MDYTTQLDLDLSALPVDDFEVVDEGMVIESLTAERLITGGRAGHYCACPCICYCVA